MAKINLVFLVFVSSLIFGGCAELVKKDFKPARAGVVKYNTGWLMAEKNRAKALELAAEHCGRGKVSILSEESRTELTGNSSTRGKVEGNTYESNTSQSKEKAIYIKFRCAR